MRAEVANDKAVDAVGVGAVAVGAQPLNASIAGEKPMFWGVSVNQVDTKNKTASSSSATRSTSWRRGGPSAATC